MTDIDWELLVRYRGRECTPDERERFERWLAADPEHRQVYDAIVLAADRLGRRLEAREAGQRRTVPAPGLDSASPGGRDAFATPRPRRFGAAAPRAPRVMTERAWGRRRVAVALAASVAAVAAGVHAWRGAAYFDATAGNRRSDVQQVVTTARGQRATLRLADGTRVVLAPASTLRYANDFGVGGREVALDGEAYFDVVHDETRPFLVRAGNAVAEDRGTRFVVRAYGAQRHVDVAVASGVVALRSSRAAAGEASVLTRGQLGRLTADGRAVVTAAADIDAYVGWTQGRLVFHDTPLAEAAEELSRWYDVDVRLASPALAAAPLTATLQDEPASEVLALIAATLNLKLTREGHVFTLGPK